MKDNEKKHNGDVSKCRIDCKMSSHFEMLLLSKLLHMVVQEASTSGCIIFLTLVVSSRGVISCKQDYRAQKGGGR